MSDRLKINRGSDKDFIIKIRSKDNNDPVNLTSATKIAITLTKSNRSLLVRDNSLMPAKKAFVDINNVRIIADNAGMNGNSIILLFNGVDNLNTVIADWNSSNPTNTISHNGSGTQVFDGEYQLEGGADAYYPVTIEGNPLLGKIRVHLSDFDTSSLRLGLNQSLTVTIDFGIHPTGIRKITRYDNKVDILENNPVFV